MLTAKEIKEVWGTLLGILAFFVIFLAIVSLVDFPQEKNGVSVSDGYGELVVYNDNTFDAHVTVVIMGYDGREHEKEYYAPLMSSYQHHLLKGEDFLRIKEVKVN